MLVLNYLVKYWVSIVKITDYETMSNAKKAFSLKTWSEEFNGKQIKWTPNYPLNYTQHHWKVFGLTSWNRHQRINMSWTIRDQDQQEPPQHGFYCQKCKPTLALADGLVLHPIIRSGSCVQVCPLGSRSHFPEWKDAGVRRPPVHVSYCLSVNAASGTCNQITVVT